MSDRPPRRRHDGAHELARYGALFASRTEGMRSSAMRDLMAITQRPEVISLAGGLPDTSTFTGERFTEIMQRVARDSARALQYGPTEGIAAVADCIVRVMAAEGTIVRPEEVLVTTGGQQVIDLVCKTLIDPGDVIVAEAPTYPGAVPTFTAYQADVVQIATDDDGMRVEELETTLDALAATGRRPKFIYTIPTFQNPGGMTLSLERRRRLVELARERELLVLEDNPYGLLRYEGEPLPTLYSLDADISGRGGPSDYVMYLGTFSKILSPGIRLGWAVAPGPVLAKFNQAKQGIDLCSSSLSQLFVVEFFADGDGWLRYVNELRALYADRREEMLAALEQHFGPDARWTRPAGGMFIWATLPSYIDTRDLLARAQEENVAFVPGQAAYVDGRGGSSMRLNFSGVSRPDIREGVRRIGAVIAEQVDLYGSLTGSARPRPAASGRPASEPADDDDGPKADVLQLPRRAARRDR